MGFFPPLARNIVPTDGFENAFSRQKVLKQPALLAKMLCSPALAGG